MDDAGFPMEVAARALSGRCYSRNDVDARRKITLVELTYTATRAMDSPRLKADDLSSKRHFV